jgi:xylan 1,4-beta-xylosidase
MSSTATVALTDCLSCRFSHDAQFAAVSDIFQEHNISAVVRQQGLPQVEFSSAYGLQTVSGVRKPGWRAFQLAHQSGDLKIDSLTSSENETSAFHAFATSTSAAPADLSSLMVFLSLWENPYSRGPPHHTTPAHQVIANRTVAIQIVHDDPAAAASAIDTIWMTRIDEQHANPQRAWIAMGSPAVPSPQQLQALHEASALRPQQIRAYSRCHPAPVASGVACINVTVELAPNTAVLLSLKKPAVANAT